HLLEQLGSTEGGAGREQEALEQRELLRREPDARAVHERAARLPVERDPRVRECIIAYRATATDECADTRLQLVEHERLDEIIVGAGVEAAHDVLGSVLRGEHEDGYVLALRADLAGDVVT